MTTTEPTWRLLVVADHPVGRRGLVAMRSEHADVEGVGEAVDGAAATARLRAGPDAPAVLVLTTYDTDADIVRAVEAGANGYLLKDSPREVLADAIRRAARGETVLAPPVVARLASRMRAPTGPALTERETDVLRCVAKGLSNAAVGRELHIGEATVKTHLLRAFEKLGVTDRTAAVTAALRAGLIDL